MMMMMALPQTAKHYLKSYPYLFVRETDQTSYLCTLCDSDLKEDDLQTHLFDGHRAEKCAGSFVRVQSGHQHQPTHNSPHSPLDSASMSTSNIYVCVVCWAKLAFFADTVSHRVSCKAAGHMSPQEGAAAADVDNEEEGNHDTGAACGGQSDAAAPAQPPASKSSSAKQFTSSLGLVRRQLQECLPTNVVSTPDIPSFMFDPDRSSPEAKPSLEKPPASVKQRGRKKQLHPQQVLPHYRLHQEQKEGCSPLLNGNTHQREEQCCLCNVIVPVADLAKHLKHFHRMSGVVDQVTCIMCAQTVSLNQINAHLAAIHAVTSWSAVNALLLCMLTTTASSANIVDDDHKPDQPARSHSDVDKSAAQNLEMRSRSSLPHHHLTPATSRQLTTTTLSSHQPASPGSQVQTQSVCSRASSSVLGNTMLHLPSVMLQNVFPKFHSSSALLPSTNQAPIPSFLQALLNGESPPTAAAEAIQAPVPQLSAVPPMSQAAAGFSTATSTCLASGKQVTIEAIVTKLTRCHVGPNAKESYQCLVCTKWFAVPPVKHLRGHLITFKEEKRRLVSLAAIGQHYQACLTCFQIFSNPIAADYHVRTEHALNDPATQHNQGAMVSDELTLAAAAAAAAAVTYSESPVSTMVPPATSTTPSIITTGLGPTSNHPTMVQAAGKPGKSRLLLQCDPKGVELDNAGRVKSGKVRKQCELCGQWSNIKWFFKHMSEIHQALFCRCCREYLPIHEQEEHRRWHAEPPYMGQKIRIENGQPIIVDRKERASLTPIGSLAAWGGSSGGLVVKAVDDSIIPATRKRKSNNLAAELVNDSSSPSKLSLMNCSDSGRCSAAGKDTLMPKETCPVCGILITYKNLARHIKLRHKIKYKFCHKCRKFVPNDTYEEHKLTCISVPSPPPSHADNSNGNGGPDHTGFAEGVNSSLEETMSLSAQDPAQDEEDNDEDDDVELIDLPMDEDENDESSSNNNNYNHSSFSHTAASKEGSEDLSSIDSKNPEHFRASTSKNKLESLMGKEFKHPRRKCSICGYTVSYSNFKRHLRNAHPAEYSQCEKEPGGDFGKAFAAFSQIVDEDVNDKENTNGDFVECSICGDYILPEFLTRHMKMNHPDCMADWDVEDEDDDNRLDGTKESRSEQHSDEPDDEDDEDDGQEPKVAQDHGDPVVKRSKSQRIRPCPECAELLKAELVVKHCKVKHKKLFKLCSLCDTYIDRTDFRWHIRSKHAAPAGPITRFGDAKSSLSTLQPPTKEVQNHSPNSGYHNENDAEEEMDDDDDDVDDDVDNDDDDDDNDDDDDEGRLTIDEQHQHHASSGTSELSISNSKR